MARRLATIPQNYYSSRVELFLDFCQIFHSLCFSAFISLTQRHNLASPQSPLKLLVSFVAPAKSLDAMTWTLSRSNFSGGRFCDCIIAAHSFCRVARPRTPTRIISNSVRTSTLLAAPRARAKDLAESPPLFFSFLSAVSVLEW